MTARDLLGLRIAFNNAKRNPHNGPWWWLHNTRNEDFYFAITTIRPRLIRDKYGWWFAIIRYDTTTDEMVDAPWIEWDNDERKLNIRLVHR